MVFFAGAPGLGSSGGVADAEACQATCVASGECQFFTYFKTGREAGFCALSSVRTASADPNAIYVLKKANALF